MSDEDIRKSREAVEAFTEKVASLYRRFGFEVQRDVPLAGTRIDLWCTLHGPNGNRHVAVELKLYRDLAGLRTIEEVAAVASVLKSQRTIDEVHLVVSSGFTTVALDRAARHGIVALAFSALEGHLAQLEAKPESRASGIARRQLGISDDDPKKHLFVLMPFDPEFWDLFEYGIVPVARGHGLYATTADDPQENSGILAMIQREIKSADVVLGVAAGVGFDSKGEPILNPNVMYEIGFSHATRPDHSTIIASKEGTPLASDLRDIHHLIYDSIRDFRPKFARKLEALGHRKQVEYKF